MNLLELISSFLAILTLILAIYILYLEPRNIVHRLFFVMMLLYSYWEFIQVGMMLTENKETFVFLIKMVTPSLLFIPMTLHIVVHIVKLRKKIIIPLLSVTYAVYLFFLYQFLNINLIYRDFIKTDGYWYFIRKDPDFITIFFMTVYGIILMIAMVLILYWNRKTKFMREKKQAAVLLISLVLLFAFTFIDFVIFYLTKSDIGIYAYYICVWPIGIGYSIIRYRFLAPDPGLYSRDIFENIEESVLVLNHNKEILYANVNAKKIIFDDADDPKAGKFIQGLDSITEVADNLFKGSINNCIENIVGIHKDNSKSAFRVKFSAIKDKYNDRIGVLVIAQQLKGIKEFTAEHNITDRELDVIKHVVNGLSNREIAGKLNISERTIETHLVNIYSKMGIKKRVELINIFKRYIFA